MTVIGRSQSDFEPAIRFDLVTDQGQVAMAIETLMAYCERDPLIVRSGDADRHLGDLCTALTEALAPLCDRGARRVSVSLWSRWGAVTLGIRHAAGDIVSVPGHGAMGEDSAAMSNLWSNGALSLVSNAMDDVSLGRIDGVDVMILEKRL